jgi:hydroxypyruvate isomerase
VTRFAANLSILWPDMPLLDRPAAAVAAGFAAIELWWPFEGPVPPARDVDDLVAALQDTGVHLVLLNLWLGDRPAGQHGLLSVASARPEFLANVDVVAGIVGRLGGSIVNSHIGNVLEGADRAAMMEEATAGLTLAAPRIADAGATLVVEALNPFDFPRYGLSRVSDAVALAERASEASGTRVGILFDAYHVQRTEGDVCGPLAQAAGRVAHVQVADVPGRGRPGSGDIDFGRFFAELEGSGYDGWVGLEYLPSTDPADTFAWLSRLTDAAGSSEPGAL